MGRTQMPGRSSRSLSKVTGRYSLVVTYENLKPKVSRVRTNIIVANFPISKVIISGGPRSKRIAPPSGHPCLSFFCPHWNQKRKHRILATHRFYMEHMFIETNYIISISIFEIVTNHRHQWFQWTFGIPKTCVSLSDSIGIC